MNKANDYEKLENNQDYDRISLKDLHATETETDDNCQLIAHEASSSEENDLNPNVVYKQNLKKDFNNICLLMFLYFLQGIPLGLAGSLPFILSAHKVSYADQGTFSLAFWPFSLKLLWAPIVDSVYFKRIGRRKSWLVPVQYLLGLFMVLFANYTKELLEGTGEHPHSIIILTSIFFALTFLAATQDIAVDGWALTMLSKENVSWGSTCNSVGQTAGWFAGNVIFLTLESSDFSNKFVRYYLGWPSQTYGVVTIDKFMLFFGIVYIVSTSLIMIFKRERDSVVDDNNSSTDQQIQFTTTTTTTTTTSPTGHSLEDDLSITDTYKLMWKIIWLIPIKKLIIILMTVKIAFATDQMSYLKMIDSGVPKDKLALLAVPLTPLQIVLPLLISKYTNGPQPFNFFIQAIPFRLFMGIIIAAFVYMTPYFRAGDSQEYPLYYYMLCLVINAVHSVFAYMMFVSQMAFFAKISDKTIGGTYMTFLNTISNMGGVWPSTFALYIASFLTYKKCELNSGLHLNSTAQQFNSTLLSAIEANKCGNEIESKECTSHLSGICTTTLDAYYLMTVACTCFGICWILYFKKVMYNLQAMPRKSYKISKMAIQ
jgi:PAT family acetyl-CoA transporter-like MFS transporter 1